MAEQEAVSVRILDREYRVMCTPAERRKLMEAAMFLDKEMRSIRESGKLSSAEKIAVMCALNLADELLRAREDASERESQVDRRILALADRLEPAPAEE
ncbi:MAG: cell division protein ZapA [Wenzhouxiangellaceae bacterium]|nr:cell division protein ZapA [Wenzhouxiangellaceae bacterium]